MSIEKPQISFFFPRLILNITQPFFFFAVGEERGSGEGGPGAVRHCLAQAVPSLRGPQ